MSAIGAIPTPGSAPRLSEPEPRRRLRGLARRVPPVHSPLTATSLWHGALSAARLEDDARPRFESHLRAFYHADAALLVDRGTGALQLAIELATTPGETPAVALPAFTCFDAATAAAGAGARVFLYDVDPRTLAPDLATLEATLAAGARVVVVAACCGIPVDLAPIEECVRRHGAVMIEDAAQGHGATWGDRPLGSRGEQSVLSFGRGKGWTGGSGGALLARGAFAMRLGRMRAAEPALPTEVGALAATAAQWALGRPGCYWLPAAMPWLHLGETRYRPPAAPRRLARGAARVLERTLASASREADARRDNAAGWLELLEPARVETIRVPPGSQPGYLRFPVLVRLGLSGLSDARRARRLGAAPGYPMTLAQLRAVSERLQTPPGAGRWPGAEDLVRRLVTLPTHSLVTDEDKQELAALINRS